LSYDARRAAFGCANGIVYVWDLLTGACESLPLLHHDIISTLAITLDGRRALFGGGTTHFHSWDLTTGSHELTPRLDDLNEHDTEHYPGDPLHDFPSVAIAADGCRAVSGGLDTCVRVWDLQKGVGTLELRCCVIQ
jgi:WD40 repeat protein